MRIRIHNIHIDDEYIFIYVYIFSELPIILNVTSTQSICSRVLCVIFSRISRISIDSNCFQRNQFLLLTFCLHLCCECESILAKAIDELRPLHLSPVIYYCHSVNHFHGFQWGRLQFLTELYRV